MMDKPKRTAALLSSSAAFSMGAAIIYGDVEQERKRQDDNAKMGALIEKSKKLGLRSSRFG